MVYLGKRHLNRAENYFGRVCKMNKLKEYMWRVVAFCLIFSAFFLCGDGAGSVCAADVKTSEILAKESSPNDFTIDKNGCLTCYSGCAEAVIIPPNVKSISFGVFMDKPEIKAVVFSEGLISIDEYAFYGCTQLREVILPESVESVSRLAFGDCENIEVLYIGKNVKSWGEFALLGCKSLSYLSVNDENLNYSGCDGILYDKNFKKLICCPSGHDGEIEVHENTLTIGSYAFFECENIVKVSTSDNLKYVDEMAFCGCKNLLEVNLGKNVKKMRAACFEKCSSLKKIIIPKSVMSVGSVAFFECPSLERVIFLNNTTEIGEKIFSKNKRKKNVIIVGYDGSTAEIYAKNNGYTFEKITNL